MRKIKCIFLVAVGSFLWASCNSKTADKATEVSKVTTEVSANKTEISEEDYKEGKWLEQLPEKKPLTLGQLEASVPKSLNGMPLIKVVDDSKNGRAGIKAVYSNTDNPSKEAIHINFFITDGAGEEGYKHLKSTFNMLKFPIHTNDGVKISKIEDWNNKRLATNQRLVKDKWISHTEFIQNQRFHLKIEGQNLKAEQLSEALNTISQLSLPE